MQSLPGNNALFLAHRSKKWQIDKNYPSSSMATGLLTLTSFFRLENKSLSLQSRWAPPAEPVQGPLLLTTLLCIPPQSRLVDTPGLGTYCSASSATSSHVDGLQQPLHSPRATPDGCRISLPRLAWSHMSPLCSDSIRESPIPSEQPCHLRGSTRRSWVSSRPGEGNGPVLPCWQPPKRTDKRPRAQGGKDRG